MPSSRMNCLVRQNLIRLSVRPCLRSRSASSNSWLSLARCASALLVERICWTRFVISPGSVGQSVVFDPNRHESLSAEDELRPGANVIIRLVGLSYKGKLLRKAGVIAGGE